MAVLWSYADYFPPQFDSEFLRGREATFYGTYQWSFFVHVIAGPLTLVFGLVLLSKQLRQRFPRGHRFIGRIQVVCVLIVAASGLRMAFNAGAGAIAGVSLGLLALLTGLSILAGWIHAVRRQFVLHRRWMLRCFVLLCSAVVLRLIGGFGTMTGVQSEWYNTIAVWVSWLVPLAALEWWIRCDRTLKPQ